MKKILKITFTLLIAVILTCTAAACGDKKSSSQENTDYKVNFKQSATTLKGDLRVIIPDNEPERKKLGAWVAGFNEKYPMVNISLDTLNISSYNSTIITQAQSEVLADIIWCNSSNYYFLIANGVALNLDPFTAQAKEAGIFDINNDFAEDFKTMGKYNGHLYAVARSLDSVVTFYNKDILTAARVDMNTIENGWSWETFMVACQKVRDYYDNNNQPKHYPLDANIGWESIGYPLIKSFGGEVLNSKGEFALTEEVSNKVYDFIQTLIDKRFIPVKGDSTSNFESGTGAFLFQSASIDNYQEKATTRGKFDVVSFPLINGNSSAIGNGFAGYAVNSSVAKDQNKLDIAAAFMSYLMSVEGQQKMAKDGGLNLPSIRKELGADNADSQWCAVYKDQFNVAAYTYGANMKVGMDFLSYAGADKATTIVNALNTYTGTNCIDKTKAQAYKLFKGAIEDAFDEV